MTFNVFIRKFHFNIAICSTIAFYVIHYSTSFMMNSRGFCLSNNALKLCMVHMIYNVIDFHSYTQLRYLIQSQHFPLNISVYWKCMVRRLQYLYIFFSLLHTIFPLDEILTHGVWVYEPNYVHSVNIAKQTILFHDV